MTDKRCDKHGCELKLMTYFGSMGKEGMVCPKCQGEMAEQMRAIYRLDPNLLKSVLSDD